MWHKKQRQYEEMEERQIADQEMQEVWAVASRRRSCVACAHLCFSMLGAGRWRQRQAPASFLAS